MQNTITTQRTTHRHYWVANAILLAASAALVAVMVALNDAPAPVRPSAQPAVARVPAAGYAALKDSQLSRVDNAPVQAVALSISAQDRYATVKDQQLEKAEAAIGTILGERDNYFAFKDQQFVRAESIREAVTTAALLSGAERYANLKDAQFDRLDSARETFSLGLSRYMTLKDEQLVNGGW